jgi:Zn-dependent protease
MFLKLPPQVLVAAVILMDINLYWPLFNLLPVWPLDGGMVSREICTGLSPRRGLQISLGLSIGVAGFIAIHALLARGRGVPLVPYLPTSTYAAILFGLLAFQSWQLLQQVRAYHPPVDDRLPWESDPDAWKR